jgi:hypothetical protein
MNERPCIQHMPWRCPSLTLMPPAYRGMAHRLMHTPVSRTAAASQACGRGISRNQKCGSTKQRGDGEAASHAISAARCCHGGRCTLLLPRQAAGCGARGRSGACTCCGGHTTTTTDRCSIIARSIRRQPACSQHTAHAGRTREVRWWQAIVDCTIHAIQAAYCSRMV